MKRLLRTGALAALLPLTAITASGDPPGRTGEVIATRVVTVADDFVVDVYHNGLKVPDEKRTLLVERFGATAERLDLEVRRGDWLVFNVVNNRLRWGGCSYFAVSGRGDAGVAFTTEPTSGRWSRCDDPGKVNRFVLDRDFLSDDRAQAVANPWPEGDGLMRFLADGWGGTPVWGKTRNTWIKYVAR